MSACRSCSAPIFWMKTQRGKPMPLDKEPHPEGNVIIEDGVAVVLHSPAQVAALSPTRRRFMPHFATCPTVDQHRKPKVSS